MTDEIVIREHVYSTEETLMDILDVLKQIAAALDRLAPKVEEPRWEQW